STDLNSALDEIGVRFTGAKLSASRGATIQRGGLDLDVVTAKQLTVVNGRKKPVARTVRALTVGESLRQLGIQLDRDDQVRPRRGVKVKSGTKTRITYVDIVKRQVRNAAWHYQTVTERDSSMYEDEKVTVREGIPGS